MRVVRSKDEIRTIRSNETLIHLTFRPSDKDIVSIVMNCPSLKALHVPRSYKRTLSCDSLNFLKSQEVDILEGEVGGFDTYIDKYSEISHTIYDTITKYKEKGLSYEEIEERVNQETNLGPDFIKFLLQQGH